MTDAPRPGIDAPPTREQVRAWVAVTGTSITDDELDIVIAAELKAQARLCTVVPWSPELTQALYRRVGRQVAAMNTPLGVTPSAEFGSRNLPRYDAEIERIEAPLRKQVTA